MAWGADPVVALDVTAGDLVFLTGAGGRPGLFRLAPGTAGAGR